MNGADRQPDLLRLRVLGGFDLQPGDGLVMPAGERSATPVLGRKTRGLLACLALSPGKAWPRERLMALLWSDRSEDQARASLRQALAEIRRAIGAQVVRTGDDAISLESALFAVDALDFNRLAQASQWEEAAALYQGPFLDGHGVHDDGFEDWVRGERQRLQELAIDVLERLVASRKGDAAIAAAQRLLSMDPVRETTHRLLMRLYAEAGQRAKALRQYEHCCDILERDLQAKPDAETVQLHRQIRDEAVSIAATAGNAKRHPDDRAEVKLSIAVLPFANMSGDPTQDYFSSGIAEDIVTELARFRFLFVITGRDRVSDAREAGHRLGARYAVEGQVRRAGNRVRVTVHLIDCLSGSHLWGERFDRAFDDIFLVQEEIARRIIENLAPRVEAEGFDTARRKLPEDMLAYDCYLRAKALFQWPRDAADLQQGRDYCDRAIAIDPSYARAHAEKSFSYAIGIYILEQDDVETWRRRALECAERAVLLDPLDGFCHQRLAEAAFLSGEHDRARDHIARSLEINPNDADVLATSSYLHAYAGDPEAGLREIDLSLKHNPTRPSWYHWVRGCVLYILGRFEEAIRACKLHSPANADTLLTCSVALAELGRLDEAQAEIQTLLTIRPGATIRIVRSHYYFLPDLDRYLDNLRKSGLPEG
ncbi:MAG TPA: BTAD domain-containing putative transcriptional regulator [Terriglobales bacterium]|nr:BTAD domain-containing putative transcriptional regulator [Terriglobales bacterium]